MKHIKLAWRNLWRSPRRSMITMASVFFGVIMSTIMTSMQHGSYDSMIDNVVKFYSGYAQVFSVKYDENKTINNTFALNDSIVNIIKQCNKVTETSPRLEYFALASSEELTKGTVVLGIDPQNENQVTDLQKWVHKGKYLEDKDDGVIISVNLADYLKLTIGDTLVLYGQGYHGVTAAGLFPVRGILKFPVPELNNQLVYMTLQSAQDLFGAPGRASYLIIMVTDHYDLPETKIYLDENITDHLMAKTWNELQPELVSMIEADRAGGIFMKLILYMVIGFGIFGTIIMMVAERQRELGVTIAVGMQRYKLAWIMFLETIFTGFAGSLTGIIGSIPIIAYLFAYPISLTGDAAQAMIDMGIEPMLYFSWKPAVFYNQALIVFFLTAVIAIYPIYKVSKLKVNQALRA